MSSRLRVGGWPGNSSGAGGLQISEALARTVQHRRLAGELLPPLHGDIDVGRVQFDPVADPPVVSAAISVVPEPMKGS